MKNSDAVQKYSYVRKTYTFDGHRYEVRGKTEKEAVEKLAELKSSLRRGEQGVSSNMLAADWCRKWLEVYVKPRVRQPGQPKQKNTMSPKSYRTTYESKMNQYIIPGLGRLKLKDVRDTHLMSILNAEAGGSFSNVSKIRMVIKAVFAQAAASRLIPYDPALNLALPVTTKHSRRSLTKEERAAFDKVCSNPDYKQGLWFRFLIGTGLRPGEAVALQVKDIDFNNGLVYVCKAVESGTMLVTEPKTAASVRHVPVPDRLLDDLRVYVRGKAPEALLFSQVRKPGAMLTEICLKRYWQTLCRLMDIELGAERTSRGHIYDPSDINPDGTPIYPDPKDKSRPRNGHKLAPDLCLYCLRHTYCTDLQRAGVPLNEAKTLMGHTDVSTTANIYSHPDLDDALSAKELINKYLYS